MSRLNPELLDTAILARKRALGFPSRELGLQVATVSVQHLRGWKPELQYSCLHSKPVVPLSRPSSSYKIIYTSCLAVLCTCPWHGVSSGMLEFIFGGRNEDVEDPTGQMWKQRSRASADGSSRLRASCQSVWSLLAVSFT